MSTQIDLHFIKIHVLNSWQRLGFEDFFYIYTNLSRDKKLLATLSTHKKLCFFFTFYILIFFIYVCFVLMEILYGNLNNVSI